MSKAAHGSPAHHGPSSKGHGNQGHGNQGHSSQGHSSPGHGSQSHSSTGHSSQGHGSPGHGNQGHGSPGHGSPGHHGASGSLASHSSHSLDHEGQDHCDGDMELTAAEIWEKEKQELKTKLTELEDYKGKYEDEKKENQILQNRLSELMAGQSDATQRLMRTNENFDRLKLDHSKKVELIEKMQRDISFKDDRIRQLEIRASEVEKAELILETTKTNLESTVMQVRAREGEIRRLNKDIDDLTRQLELGNSKLKDTEARVEDLKIQVRHELLKNDNIEKNLETIPRLKDTIQEKEAMIQEQRQELEDKTALLAAARRAVREYKEKLRSLEREITRTEQLKHDLDISQSEVVTLKKLMYGKDYLVTQKSKALDLSKEIIEVMNDTMDNDHMQRIQHLLDRVATPSSSARLHETSPSSVSRETSFSYPSDSDSRPQSTPPRHRSVTPSPAHHREISVNNHPYGIDANQQPQQNGKEKHVFLNKVIGDSSGKRKRPVSAVPPETRSSSESRPKSSVHRTSSMREAHKVYTQPLPRKNNHYEIEIVQVPNCYKSDKGAETKMKPSLDYKIGAQNEKESCDRTTACSSTPRDSARDSQTQEQAFSDSDSEHSDDTDYEEALTEEQEKLLRNHNAREKDFFLTEIINIGDRVLFKRQQKPPKYGIKKAPKPLMLTGIVKYKGKLDEEKYDARIYVGVRMDEPVGDTDGTVKGKRLMYTPADQGKFYKMREITSVLNIKKVDPSGAPTLSAHPARFSPDDKFSRHRVTIKKRFGILPTQQPKPEY